MSLLFKEDMQKETKMSFWDCHVTVNKLSNGHTYSPRETIIHCLPTAQIQKYCRFIIVKSFIIFTINTIHKAPDFIQQEIQFL